LDTNFCPAFIKEVVFIILQLLFTFVIFTFLPLSLIPFAARRKTALQLMTGLKEPTHSVSGNKIRTFAPVDGQLHPLILWLVDWNFVGLLYLSVYLCISVS
jgi:hypothetical protein